MLLSEEGVYCGVIWFCVKENCLYKGLSKYVGERILWLLLYIIRGFYNVLIIKLFIINLYIFNIFLEYDYFYIFKILYVVDIYILVDFM